MSRPNLSYLKNVLLFLIGLPCGALTGLTGISNSVATMPLLRFLLGLQGIRLNACALAITFFCALGSLLSYSQTGNINLSLAVLLAIGQLFGAALGRLTAKRFPALGKLRPLWAILIIALGIFMVARPTVINDLGGASPLVFTSSPWLAVVRLLFVGIAVGFISSITELGGVLLVPAAIVLLHLSPHAAQGTAIVVLLLASLPGMLLYLPTKAIDPQVATWVSFGGIFGSLTGAYYATHYFSDQALIMLFGIAMALIGLMMFRSADTPMKAAPPNAAAN